MIRKWLKKGATMGAAAARLVAQEVKERRHRPVVGGELDPDSPDVVERKETPSIEPAELLALLEDGERVLLLDCRDAVEWEAGYIQGATHLPMSTLPEHIKGLDPNGRVIVVCLNGVESAEVAEYLVLHNGFTNVKVVDGGMVAWYADLGQERIHVLRAEERTP